MLNLPKIMSDPKLEALNQISLAESEDFHLDSISNNPNIYQEAIRFISLHTNITQQPLLQITQKIFYTACSKNDLDTVKLLLDEKLQ